MRGKDGKTFWERVVEALRDQGIVKNQPTEVAKMLQIRQPSVWEWEKGVTHPSMANARALAAKLGVSTAWLLDGLGDKRPVPTNDREAERLWMIWQRLEPSERAKVLGFAEGLDQAGPIAPGSGVPPSIPRTGS